MRAKSQWLLLAVFLIGPFTGVAYSETNEALQACLDKADQMMVESLRILCLTDDNINGGTEHGKEACYKFTAEDALGYLVTQGKSEYYRKLFDRILNQRKSDREDCFNQFR
jgi:hypothetical protein